MKLSLKTLERCSEEYPHLWELVSSRQLEGLNALLTENHFDKCRISAKLSAKINEPLEIEADCDEELEVPEADSSFQE